LPLFPPRPLVRRHHRFLTPPSSGHHGAPPPSSHLRSGPRISAAVAAVGRHREKSVGRKRLAVVETVTAAAAASRRRSRMSGQRDDRTIRVQARPHAAATAAAFGPFGCCRARRRGTTVAAVPVERKGTARRGKPKVG
ncbi:unnamed protein product, partial [Ectocarpus sp. 12 AP-2014]